MKKTYQSKTKANQVPVPALAKPSQPIETLVDSSAKGVQARRVTAVVPAPAMSPAAREARAHQLIKLGVDVPADRYVVVRQIEGGAPQPPPQLSPAQFLSWAKKQAALAERVYCCYEAGPFGYSLHRKLAALGVTNYVVRPRDWDE